MPKQREPRIIVKCVACGQEVERTEREVRVNTSGRFFCSAACQHKVGVKPTTIKHRPCETCGTMFKPISHKNVGRFCSVKCREVWQARNQIKRTCAVCGSEFLVSASRARRTPADYCSSRCRGVARTVRGIGRFHNGREATLNDDGYVMVYEPDHPKANAGNKRILEHRLVAEQVIGRPLALDEQVHHLNGDKTDNSEDNLFVLNATAHQAITLAESAVKRRAAQARIRELESKLAEYEQKFGPI